MKQMIEIDGSIGEGGGQVFRNALSYAAITEQPMHISNIRANRSPPGLKPQHLTALQLMQKITNAEVSGDYKGSEEVSFAPQKIQGGTYSADTGTAASLTLLLQAVLPTTLFAASSVHLTLRGGTDVKWSPPVDSLRFVFLPFLRTIGVDCDLEVVKRGHYPKGGGIVKVSSHPLDRSLEAVQLRERERVEAIKGRSHCVSLPKHVAERQAKAARGNLNEEGYRQVSIEVEWYEKSEDPHLGPGSGIVLWAESSKMLVEADALGAKGKPAEKVGRGAAEKLIRQLQRKGTVDLHHTDHLIPFIAMARGKSVVHSCELTSHTLTAIELAEKCFDVEFQVNGNKGDSGVISVEGAALTR